VVEKNAGSGRLYDTWSRPRHQRTEV